MKPATLLHLADTHLDKNRRLNDTAAVLDEIVVAARSERVDLVVHAGDFFHRNSSPEERNLLAGFIRRITETIPFVGIRGNHDALGDLDLFGDLATSRPAIVITRARRIEIGGFSVYGLPWFSKLELVASARASGDSSSGSEAAISKARELLELTRVDDGAARTLIPILIAHAQVAGAETSTGQTLIGTTVELSPSDLFATGAEYVGLGHIHLRQEWHGGQVAYAGSTEAMNFGEPETKSFNLVEFYGGKFVSNEAIPIEASRRIILLELSYAEALDVASRRLDMTHPKTIAAREADGALVRVRYQVAPEDLATIRTEDLSSYFCLAESVKVEARIIVEKRVRSELIAEAKTTRDKMSAYWAAKNNAPGAATQAAIFEKIEELEELTDDEILNPWRDPSDFKARITLEQVDSSLGESD